MFSQCNLRQENTNPWCLDLSSSVKVQIHWKPGCRSELLGWLSALMAAVIAGHEDIWRRNHKLWWSLIAVSSRFTWFWFSCLTTLPPEPLVQQELGTWSGMSDCSRSNEPINSRSHQENLQTDQDSNDNAVSKNGSLSRVQDNTQIQLAHLIKKAPDIPVVINDVYH